MVEPGGLPAKVCERGRGSGGTGTGPLSGLLPRMVRPNRNSRRIGAAGPSTPCSPRQPSNSTGSLRVRGRAMELASSIENWEKVVALGVEFQRWSAPPKAALGGGPPVGGGFVRLERHPEALLHLNTLAESFPDEPRILAYLSQLKR